jgi:hypothetical protein
LLPVPVLILRNPKKVGVKEANVMLVKQGFCCGEGNKGSSNQLQMDFTILWQNFGRILLTLVV